MQPAADGDGDQRCSSRRSASTRLVGGSAPALRSRKPSEPTSAGSADSAIEARAPRRRDRLTSRDGGHRELRSCAAATISRSPADASTPARPPRRARARPRATSRHGRSTSSTTVACPRSACRSCRRRVRRASGVLERGRVAHEHAQLRAAAGADDDRGRRRKAERTRARDDQHRNRIDERRGSRRPRIHHVDDEGQRRRWRRRPARRRPRPDRRGAGSAPWSLAPRATSRTMPASSVASPTPVASMRNAAPSWLSVPAKTCRTRTSCRRARLSPVSMLSSTLDSPSTHDAVDRNRLAGAHDQARRRAAHRCDRDVDGHAVRARRARSSAAAAISPSSAADVPALARASSSLPSSTSVITAAAASKYTCCRAGRTA